MVLFYEDLSRVDGLPTEAVRPIDSFARQDNKLEVIGYFQAQNSTQALVLVAILSWSKVRQLPEAVNKLNSFQDYQTLDGVLLKMPGKSLPDIASSINYHRLLIQKFFSQFQLQQLEELVSQNELIYVKRGIYKCDSEYTGAIQLADPIGDREAPVLITMVKNASQKQNSVILAYSTNNSEYLAKFPLRQSNYTVRSVTQSKAYQSSENPLASNVFQPKVSEPLNHPLRSTAFSIPQARQAPNDMRRSGAAHMEPEITKPQTVPERESKQILSQGSPKLSGHCQECETYSVIAPENRLCWRCFQKSNKEDPMDIIWWVAFILTVFVLLLLNYHHARESRLVTQLREYPVVNNAAQSIYDSMFSFVRKVKNNIL